MDQDEGWGSCEARKLNARDHIPSFNILVTSITGHNRDLAKLLKELGDFRAAGYRGVLLGHVSDVEVFLERLKQMTEERPEVGPMLGRAIPFDRVFHFSDPSELTSKLCETVLVYIPRLMGKSSMSGLSGGVSREK
jgi:hypothetical protein